MRLDLCDPVPDQVLLRLISPALFPEPDWTSWVDHDLQNSRMMNTGFCWTQTEPGPGSADPVISARCSWKNEWSPGTVGIHRIFHQECSGSNQNLLRPLGGPVKFPCFPQNLSGMFRMCLRELCCAFSRTFFRTFWRDGSRALAEPPSCLTCLLWSRCLKSLENWRSLQELD